MSNPLRFLVLILVLLSLGATAALLQLHTYRRTKERLSGQTTRSELSAVTQEIYADQQRAFLTMVAASLAAVVIVALVPARPREHQTSLGQIRNDMSQVDRLARTTVAQAEALLQEKGARLRTEETLHHEQLRLNQALEEKLRIGRDLHDGIIQSLYATGLTLEASRQKHGGNPAEADALVGQGINLLNTTIREVRSYIEMLARNPGASPGGLGAELAAVLESVRGARDSVFSIQIDDAAEAKLGDNQKAELIQIVRESASNALRHGAAKHLTVRLHEDGARFALMVQDDGKGFDPKTVARTGMGLANLRARTATLGGTLDLGSEPGKGARIVITFPVRNIT